MITKFNIERNQLKKDIKKIEEKLKNYEIKNEINQKINDTKINI